MNIDSAPTTFLHCPKRRLIYSCVILAIAGVGIALAGPRHLIFPDAMEYADAARGFARGDGMLDRAVWVYQFNFLEEAPSPMVRRAILYPVFEGIVFGIFGASDRAAILSSLLCFLIAVALMQRLAERLIPEGHLKGLLVLGATLWAVMDVQQIQIAVTGLSEPMFACFVVGAALMIARPLETQGLIAVGLLVGLSQWVRLNGFALLVPVILVQWSHAGRFPIRKAACVLAGAMPPLLALAWRNHGVIGDFSFVGINSAIMHNGIAGLSEHGIEHRLYTPPSSPPSLGWTLQNHPGTLAAKVWAGIEMNTAAALGTLGAIPLGGALVGSAAAWKNLSAAHRSVAVFTLSSVAICIVLFSTGEFEGPRFFVPFAPLVIVLAASAFGHISNAMRESEATSGFGSKTVVLGVGILFFLPALVALVQWSRMTPGREEIAAGAAVTKPVKVMTPAEAVIITDVPWAVAWYADRPAVWMPTMVSNVPTVVERSGAEYLFMTSWHVSGADLDPNWRGIYESGAGRPANWNPIAAEPGGILFRISDREK